MPPASPLRIRIDWQVMQHFDAVNLKLNFHYRDSTPIGITHPITLGEAKPGQRYSTVFTVDTSIFSEGQYFFYLDVFERELATPPAWTSRPRNLPSRSPTWIAPCRSGPAAGATSTSRR